MKQDDLRAAGEKLYDDLLSVPVPPSLSDEGKKFYLDELRKKVGVLVMKAIMVFERSLEMAQRVGEQNEWVKRTSESLERMKSLAMAQLDAPETTPEEAAAPAN
jgi:hypothetical protein